MSNAAKTERQFFVPVAQNPLFVGRAGILSEITEYFACGNIGQKRLVLTGLGGVGKTQIATTFVYNTYAHHDHSVVLWIFANDRGQVIKGFTEIATNLGLKARELEGPSSVPPLVHELLRWLSRENTTKWLLVFDNVDDLDNLDLATFFPKAPWGNVLITSRREQAARFGRKITIDVMELDEAVKLLHRCSQLTAGNCDKVAQQLAMTLGCLPLALDQAGAYIAEQCIDFETYIDFYEESRETLLRHKPPRAVWSYEETVFTTWEMSVAKIFELDDLAVQLLGIAAFYNSDNIPLMLVCSLIKTLDPDYPILLRQFLDFIETRFDYDAMIEAVPDSFQISKSRLQLAIGKLASFSLVRRNAQSQSIQIHPLVHFWLKERQSALDRRRYARMAINFTLRALFNAYDLSRFADAEILYLQLFICLEHVHALPDLLDATETHKIGACIIALDSWVPFSIDPDTLRKADRFYDCASRLESKSTWIIPPPMLAMRRALRFKSFGAHAETSEYCARFFQEFVPQTRYDKLYVACLARTSAPCFFRRGDYDGAEKVYNLIDDSLDSTGVAFARKQLVLGAIKIDRGLPHEAEAILSTCATHILKSVGQEHFLLNVWYQLMSLSYIELGLYAKAESTVKPQLMRRVEKFWTRQLVAFTFSDFELVEVYARILRETHRCAEGISFLVDLLAKTLLELADTPVRALGDLSLLMTRLEDAICKSETGAVQTTTTAVREVKDLMDEADRTFEKAAHAYAIEWNRGTWVFKHYPTMMEAHRLRLKKIALHSNIILEGLF